MRASGARAGRELRRGARGLSRRLAALALALGALAPALGALAGAGTDFAALEALAQKRYGAPGRAAVAAWRELLAQAARAPEPERLRAVNRFFNERIQLAADAEIWGEPDYWATPLETLGRGRGDCEDYAIAKYASLLLLGVPAQRLRLVYVKAVIGGPGSHVTQAHMVLADYPQPGAEPLILDNLLGEILPASHRPDLVPVFSFNSAGLWVGSGAAAADSHPERRLSRWGSVLLRMQQDGLRWSSGETP